MKVFNEGYTDVKEVYMFEASQTKRSYLHGLNFIRGFGKNITKDVLFHENVIFNAILHSALLKFIKKEMFQLLKVTNNSLKNGKKLFKMVIVH